jgi:hypothetical protein|tara:strand:- start:22 stop:444 length:423 start_codon:yes stop_codon:yes gene_type:complete
MKFNVGDIVYSVVLGILLGVAGVHLSGYVAAVAIPKDLLTVFSPEISVFIFSVLTQFISFGLLAIIVGIILGRRSSRWLYTSIVCYIAFILYLSVGVALVYDTEISNPYWGGLSYWWLAASYLVLPICLFMPTFLVQKRR